MHAQTRKAHGGLSSSASEIQSAQRPRGLRAGQKFLQVGESQVEAQATLGCGEVARILVGAAEKAFGVGPGGHLHETIKSDTVAGMNESDRAG